MRHPARRLFTLCSAASLVLCVVVCVFWARSYSRLDGLFWRGAVRYEGELVSQTQFDVRTANGGLFVGRADYFWLTSDGYRGLPPGWDAGSFSYPRKMVRLSRWKVRLTSNAYGLVEVVVPLWMLAVAALLPPAAWLSMARRRRRRTLLGLCPT